MTDPEPTASMMRRGATASVRATACAVVLALGGCGEVDKGSAKAADFERALTDQHGTHLDDVSTTADNVLPWSGSFHATVTVRPDVTAQTLTEVERAVAALLEGSGDTASVRANGIEICRDGDRRLPHLALRDQLRSQSRSLLGRLDCDTYAGDLASAAADIAVVQSALGTAHAAQGLPVDGRISAPRGELDGLWRELTPHLAQALGAVEASDLNTFALDGAALELNLQPGVDLDAARRSVAAVAPDVALTLRVGGAHDEDAAPPAFAGPLRNDLELLPGVQSARFVSPAAVVVRVASAADVAPTVAAAVSRSAAHGAVRLHVTTQASDTPLWTIDRGADFEVGTDPGADPADLAGFAALVADPGIGSVGWREPAGSRPGRQVTISAPAGGDLQTVLPVVKRHVPDGTSLSLHLGDDDYSFDVAPRLEREDGKVRELPATFVDTWNALP